MPKMLGAEIWLICPKWFSVFVLFSHPTKRLQFESGRWGDCNWKGLASIVADSLQSPLAKCCGSRLRVIDIWMFRSKALDEAPQVQHFRRSQRDDFDAGVAFRFFFFGRHCSDLDSKTRFLLALASAIRIVQVWPTEVSTSLESRCVLSEGSCAVSAANGCPTPCVDSGGKPGAWRTQRSVNARMIV